VSSLEALRGIPARDPPSPPVLADWPPDSTDIPTRPLSFPFLRATPFAVTPNRGAGDATPLNGAGADGDPPIIKGDHHG
jgi:hypothetical protein